MQGLVSVIIPVYNDRVRIRKALDALVNQTYSRDSYEIVVADNGSTDNTRSAVQVYCDAYPNLVRTVTENKIQSSYAARNQGLQVARGEILAFTDSDCIPELDWIELGVRALEEEGVTCGGGRIVFFFKSSRPNIYEHFDAGRKLNQQSFVQNAGFAATANFFARREVFDRHGRFRDDLISGGDYEFGRRLTKAGEKLIFIPDAVVKHPARSTFRAIVEKSQRVAEGEKQLQRLGLYDYRMVSWGQLLPRLSCPYVKDGIRAPFLIHKLHIILLGNYMRWMNFFIRMRRDPLCSNGISQE